VTCDVPGCRDVVVPGLTGLLVPPRDIERLAAALKSLILDPVLRVKMGRAARVHAEAHFSDAMATERLFEIYDDVLPGWRR